MLLPRLNLLAALSLVLCAGQTNAHHKHHPRRHRPQKPVDAVPPTPWVSKGCFTDQIHARTLVGASHTDAVGMSVAACIAFCGAGGFTYAGVEYAREYCSNALQPSGVPAHANDCGMSCTGKPAEACGGGNRVHVYFNADAEPAPKTTWEYVGCYTDDVKARSLPEQMHVAGGVTAQKCTAACEAKGYVLAGTE
ncbi:WSC domain-containing protein, partial [Mycena rebaudengoi]